jgi:hypothetical protein
MSWIFHSSMITCPTVNYILSFKNRDTVKRPAKLRKWGHMKEGPKGIG